jgi:hypothetical protein
MQAISEYNIEYLLGALRDVHSKSFGEITDSLGKNTALVKKDVDRCQTYFELQNKPEYILRVESRTGGLDPRRGPAKFEVHYTSKHEIFEKKKDFVKPAWADEPTSDLAAILGRARAAGLGIDYVTRQLAKLGLKWESGGTHNSTYVGDAVMAGQVVGIRVDLREVPDLPKYLAFSNWKLHAYVQIFPQFKPAPVERHAQKEEPQHYCGMPLFRTAAAIKP